MSRYTRGIHAAQAALKELNQIGPIGAVEDPQAAMLVVSKAWSAIDAVAAYIQDHYTDSEVEPGPERRAQLIDERVVGGVVTAVDGPKATSKGEVWS